MWATQWAGKRISRFISGLWIVGRLHSPPSERCFVLETSEGSETEVGLLDAGVLAVGGDELAQGFLVHVFSEVLDRAEGVLRLGVAFPLDEEAELVTHSSVPAESFDVEVLLSTDVLGGWWLDVLWPVGEGLGSIHILLQVLGVDDRVDLEGCGELQLVGDRCDDFEDLERAVVAGLELDLGVFGERHLELACREEDLISWLKGDVSSLLVCVLGLDLLGLEDGRAGLGEVLTDVREELGDGLGNRLQRGDAEGERSVGVLTRVQEEGGETGGCVDGVVVRELGGHEVLIPVVVVGADVSAKHLNHGAVGSLGLAIRLGVTSRGHVEVSLEGALQLDPELARELGITVGDEACWESMMPEDGFEVECCDLFRGDSVSGGFHNDHLGQAVH